MPLSGNQLSLQEAIAPYPIANPPPKPCTHPRFMPGLDAHYCPDCGKSINATTTEYKELLRRR
ncbi:hypothetical protein [Egbenema bharatensis]|uniref:hypothetical protein n=1 Tax=Egbenema bharatensis TaxID=3463334 RepID=UPI003A83A882